MHQCAYVYCRARLDDPAEPCPRCGHPPDPATLRDPAFFLGSMASLTWLPRPFLDLHQILPRYPSIERYQLLAMDQLGISRCLLQSAPDEAPSLQGNAGLRNQRHSRVFLDYRINLFFSFFATVLVLSIKHNVSNIGNCPYVLNSPKK